MPVADAEKYRFNVFDVTKVWPHSDYPLIDVGTLTLDRNPDNYHEEVEQSAFTPAHMVPGIEPSYDKMLQGRLFSYGDTHRHRLGGNYNKLKINCPYRTQVNNDNRDGFMNYGNQKSAPNYHPNTPSPFVFNNRAKLSSNQTVRGTLARFKANHPNCDFAQPGQLWSKVLDGYNQNHLVDNIVGHLKNARRDLQERQVKIF